MGLEAALEMETQAAQYSADRGLQAELNRLSLELSAVSTPPSSYGERRFNWLKARGFPQTKQREGGSSLPLSPAQPNAKRYQAPPSRGALQQLLEQARGLGGYLPRATLQALGQGFPKPLNQSQSERRESLFSPDQYTHLKSPPLRYTSVYTPSVSPHARETVYNGVSDLGDLYIKSGQQLKTRAPLVISRLAQCLETGTFSPHPSVKRTLFLGEGSWVEPEQLSLPCARSICRQAGVICFLGSYDIQRWADPGLARGISSVAPSQQLALVNQSKALNLLSDEADNIYVSSRERLTGLTWLHLLVAVQSSYLSGSWRAPVTASATLSALQGSDSHLAEHASLAVELPRALKRQALSVAPSLGFSSQDPYHQALYKLVSWHRSFTLGELDQLPADQSLYQRLLLSQKGVCRHRAYSFLISARALGIPTRMVVNATHAFVEVLDPTGAWRRVDLGGEGPFIERPLDQRFKEALAREVVRDGLPQPPAYHAAQRESARELAAYYQRPLQEQRLLQSSRSSAEGAAHAPVQPGAHTAEGETGAIGLSPRPPAELELLGVGAVFSSELNLRGDSVERVDAAERDPSRQQSQRWEEDQTHTAKLFNGPQPSCPPLSAREAKALKPPKLRSPQPYGAQLTLSATLKREVTPTRCAWVEVTGRARISREIRATGALRAALKDSKLLLHVTPEGDHQSTPLEGWGSLDHRGRFMIKARLPISLHRSTLKLSVHLPAQGPWEAVSASVYER